MAERDPLQDLHDAWRELRAPEPPATLADEDAHTRGAVEWLQGAWAVLEAPAAQPPHTLTPPQARLRRGGPRASAWPRLAAAAAVVLGAGLALWAPGTPPQQSESHESAVAPPLLPDEPSAPVLLAAATSERMEFVSGPVRLTLLKPQEHK